MSRNSFPSKWISFGILAVIFLLLAINASVDAHNYDEFEDLKILKAVQRSVFEYEQRHQQHHRHKRAEERVCYGELGCFENADFLPQSPDAIGTSFHFFSTENRSERPLFEFSYLNMMRLWRSWNGNVEIDNVTNANNVDNSTTAATAIAGRAQQTLSIEPTATTSTTTSTTSSSSQIDVPLAALKSFEGLDRMWVRVIVHGFGSTCTHDWIYEMRSALMAVDDCIVICIDWEKGATLPNYVQAASNTRLVGKQLALLLKGLQEFKGLNLDRVHLIGFSLGAHVSGFAGSELPGLYRITGLDPAGPLFEFQHPKERLDSDDAKFVDVIHSNGEGLIRGGLGSLQQMGDVDFYPNGGRVQTGCSHIFLGAITDLIWSPASASDEGRSLCNHRRAYKFFIDSVASKCLFPAFPCDNYENFLKGNCFRCNDTSTYGDSRCGNMGYYADKSLGHGRLYLMTREDEPFCAHQLLLQVYSSESDLPLRTKGHIEATLHGEYLLNETISVTENENLELFAGNVISQMLVPHPAFGLPHRITLTYKAYNGWLSRGLPVWNIDKIVLSDSFGTKYSMCHNGLRLDDDRSITVNLQPGVCEMSTENDVTFGPYEDSSTRRSGAIIATTTNNYSDEDDVDKLREKKNTQKVLNNYPFFEGGNSVDQNSAESSRSLSESGPSEISEPLLKKRPSNKASVGRSFDTNPKINSFSEEIHEPILPPRPKIRQMKQLTGDEQQKQPDKTYFNVQLLPSRLSEFFERAERIARETTKMILEKAPRFFGFGSERDEPNERKPKYIPRIGEIRNVTVSSERRLNILPPQLNDSNIVIDNSVNETENTPIEVYSESTQIASTTVEPNVMRPRRSDSKNIFSLLRVRPTARVNTTPAVIGVQQTLMSALSHGRSMASASSEYYTNADAIQTDDMLKVVRIDLPTFRPMIEKTSAFRKNSFPFKYELQSNNYSKRRR